MSDITKQRCDEIADTSGWQSVRELAEQAKACVDLRRENEQLRALLREAQGEIGQQCSIIYNSNVTPDGEVHEPEAKAELDRIDGLFRRIDAIPNGEREEP